METTMAKRKELCSGGQMASNGRDRISNLPESVLSHILSLLPTKDAVCTSVLSKDWEFKWTCIYNLTFNDLSPIQYDSDDDVIVTSTPSPSFINFVDRVIHLCKSSTLNKFELLSMHKHDPAVVRTWISAVLRRNVRNLILHNSFSGNVLDDSVFSHELFNSEFLTTVNLKNIILQVPSNVCFSKLRSLYLTAVELKNDAFITSNSQQGIIFTLPVLEELQFNYCMWRNLRILKIDAPLLKKFEMRDPIYRFGNGAIHEGVKIEISAGNLTDVKCSGFFYEEIVFSNRSILVNACFKYDVPMRNSDHRRRKMVLQACAFLGGFSAITGCLELSGDFLVHIALLLNPSILPKLMSQVEPMGPFPILDKLNCLKVSADGRAQCGKPLVNLLKRAPCLESLIISSWQDGVGGDYEGIDFEPENFLIRLKVVKFESFTGEEYQIQLVKVLLEHGLALEEMRFCWEPLRGQRFEIRVGDSTAVGYEDLVKKKAEVENILLMFPRASSHVSIVFEGCR